MVRVMKLTIISGSHRQGSQSGRISQWLQQRVEDLGLFSQVDILSLEGNPLPLWEPAIYSGDENWKKLLTPWRQSLRDADALIVVTPEWNGMVPAGLKNFFLLFGAADMGHKPALIAAISSGTGGSYPVAELRMSSYKNARVCFIPEHLIIRGVESVFTGEQPESDEFLQKRIDYALSLLKEYSSAMQQVRASGVIDHKVFTNGM